MVSAYAIAESMLGTLALSSGQMAQLRAIDHKYQQRLFTLLRTEPPESDATGSSSPADGVRALTDEETAELEAMITADILDTLSAEQRRVLRRE